jgi:4'-phosphopantetheinyl transferase
MYKDLNNTSRLKPPIENILDKHEWILGPLKPILQDNEIHIWRANLPIQASIKTELQKTLSENEQSRLNSLYFPQDKERFLVARSGLRNILARYLNTAPNHIDFHYTELGKPYINNKNIFFNISHSADCIIYALSNCSPIGIDVEHCKRDIDYLSIAKNFFSENEYLKLLTLHPDERLLAFYRCWTRKEAYIKAIGKGLHFPLDQIEVSILPNEKVQLIKIMDKAPEKDLWKIEEFCPQQDYIACVATQQSFKNCLFWDWKIV